MRLIDGGPDIPDGVRQALDAGRLVLFCGAGVSMPEAAGGPGMPTFRGLVDEVYRRLPDAMMPQERAAYDLGAYDRTLHLLEGRIRRLPVRRKVLDILTVAAPSSRHEALLELARLADGGIRLVTTNFDRQFDQAASALGLTHASNVAPMLPVPKAHRWRTMVYLHGQIPAGAGPDDPALQDLVFTSGDFGLAYLTERWASRFVTDLFTGYEILFVGYSLEDPVMRYLMDAFAADRDRAGAAPDSLPRAWAFAEHYDAADEAKQVAKWRSKGVEPIPYLVGPGHDHSLLYRTLAEWARRKRYGLEAKVKLAEEAAALTPSAPYTGPRMDAAKWALEDVAAVRRFVEADVVAPIEWLPVLEGWGLLSRSRDPGRPVALIGCQPGNEATPLGAETHLMALWLTRHLDRPELLDWVLAQGMPHPELQRLISFRLAMQLPATGSSAGPQERCHLDPALERAWRIVASPVLRRHTWSPYDIGGHVERMKAAAYDPLVRYEILRQLAPVLRLRSAAPYRAIQRTLSAGKSGTAPAAPALRDYIEIDVELASGLQATVIGDALGQHPDRNMVLGRMAEELTALLEQCLDLFALGDQASETDDPGLFRRGSIKRHEQDRHREGWTLLIDLARDGMTALRATRPDGAEALLAKWKTVPYPLFRRMVLNEYIDRV